MTDKSQQRERLTKEEAYNEAAAYLRERLSTPSAMTPRQWFETGWREAICNLPDPIAHQPAVAGAVDEEAFAEIETALVAECERAMQQRDEFLKTGESTAAPGQSHDTCFGFILRKYLRTASPSQPAVEEKPVAWAYEYNDIHDYWRQGIVMNSPDRTKNPPTRHNGKPVRFVEPLYALNTTRRRASPADDGDLLRLVDDVIDAHQECVKDGDAETRRTRSVCLNKLAAFRQKNKQS